MKEENNTMEDRFDKMFNFINEDHCIEDLEGNYYSLEDVKNFCQQELDRICEEVEGIDEFEGELVKKAIIKIIKDIHIMNR